MQYQINLHFHWSWCCYPPLPQSLLSNRGSCCSPHQPVCLFRATALTHTSHVPICQCLASILTDIDLCRPYPWARWFYTYPPTTSSPAPQSLSSVARTALWGGGGIPVDLSLTACQYCYCQCVIDVLGYLCISERHTYTGLISWSHTQTHRPAHSITGNFPWKITTIAARVKISITGSLQCLLIRFIHRSLVYGNIGGRGSGHSVGGRVGWKDHLTPLQYQRLDGNTTGR